MPRRNKDFGRLAHIRTYCTKIEGYVRQYGDTIEALRENEDYRFLVSFCIFQIGELVSGITDDFKQQNDEAIEWQSIKCMRNVIAHRYGDIDLDIVLRSIRHDVPELKAFCERVLEQRDS